MAQPATPVIGVITGIPDLLGRPGFPGAAARQPWTALAQVEESYVVTRIDTAADLEADPPDVLVVAHPGVLDQPMLYAIDQFVLNGGHAVFFLDPFFESGNALRRAPPLLRCVRCWMPGASNWTRSASPVIAPWPGPSMRARRMK